MTIHVIHKSCFIYLEFIMDQEFEAIIQDRDGWSGMRDLLTSWLTYATSREWRSTLRIHRSPHLRRILQEFNKF